MSPSALPALQRQGFSVIVHAIGGWLGHGMAWAADEPGRPTPTLMCDARLRETLNRLWALAMKHAPAPALLEWRRRLVEEAL
jgi:hypothetical protein